ncbi:hypothetical protein [Clostridium brassicae]|uniref:ABC transporter permease n=1 Tax=Clostridium brassicae TaxID=2999072 RepID=A0ABT4D7R3_9CLOT|nr:hypothetical protein [Clostridium brassicae]MCY6957271.1 hypothetical protein [Clostridium brassicae]
MRFKELLLYLKKYKVMVAITYLQITIFLILLGAFLSFTDALNYEEDGLKKVYEGKAIYQLIDGYYDEDDFSNFADQSDALVKLKNFYNSLDNADNFQYLTMMNQYVGIQNKNIPETMIEGHETGKNFPKVELDGKSYTPVKSLQMNQQAFKFFNLDVSKGRKWEEDDFKYKKDAIPVLLGDSYKNVYKIGEKFTINYYFKDINVKVIGFFKENSKVLYNGEPEFYLDRYIVLPYQNYNTPVSKKDCEFQKITYFAMVNGYVVTDNDPVKIRNMMEDVEVISQMSSFSKYSFVGFNPHLQKYNGLMMVIQENSKLIRIIFLVAFGLNLFLVSLVLFLQQKRRLPFYAIHYMQGATKFNLIIQQWLEISSIMLMSFFTYIVILDEVLMIGSYKIHLILFVLLFIISIILSFISSYQLIHKPLTDYLLMDEERVR